MSAAKKIVQEEEVKTADLVIRNKRILIVEDEPSVTEAYLDILTHRKSSLKSSRSSRAVELVEATKNDLYEVSVCSTSNEALALVKESIKTGKPFAMGFFDVMLNDRMDGVELVNEIFKLDPQMYAVFVTAYQDRNVDSINELLGPKKADSWDYLNKPFSNGEITQKARNFVTMWNLREDRNEKHSYLMEATKKVMESERATSVAAVARSVGHEFGNILLQISGTAELNQNSDATKMQEALKTILNASDTAARILEKFKNLSRGHDGFSQKQTMPIIDVVREAEALMKHQFQTDNIKFCIIKHSKASLAINKTSILQVLMNLFINAIHAMPNGGQIDVSIEQIGQEIVMRVRDYGTGVPADIITRVFDPFFTTKGDNGTGLGLSICKEIVEIEHAGSLEVRNHATKGAEFTIKLPLKDESEDES